jgi:predicted metal-binding membrane protein
MGRTACRPNPRLDPWLVVLASTSLAAWSVLAVDGSGFTMPAFCAAGTPGSVPLSVSLDLALVLNSPARLASGWALMVAAAMSPLIIAPLRHAHDRSFARRRVRAMLLFVAGYVAVWMLVGAALQVVALVGLWAAPAPPAHLGLAAAAAIVWQVSPAKQWCLNRCHRRPHLAAVGAAADRDAFTFGLTNGASCSGACWPLMLLMSFAGQAHVLGMIGLTLFVFAERLESPAPLAWRWRGSGKAVRIIAAQTRIRLGQWSGVREDRPNLARG